MWPLNVSELTGIRIYGPAAWFQMAVVLVLLGLILIHILASVVCICAHACAPPYIREI